MLRLLLVMLFLGWWFVLRIEERPSWPPPADAVTAEEAQMEAQAFLQRDDVSIEDLAIPIAPSTAADVSFYSGGGQFFPPMLDDLRAAESSIHMLMFSITPGEVADEVVTILTERADEGVEVRVIVDRYGAKADGRSKPLFDQLQAADVDVVANDIFPIDRDGPLGEGDIDWWQDEVGNADHRKMLVIDGQVGWIGGAGFEDHFADGRYHDAFARMTGDIVGQMQLVFLTSFHVLGGPSPDGATLDRYFPEADGPGVTPATLLHNVPGGFLPGTQAIRETVENAEGRLEILNPYLTDPGMLDRVVDAGERDVDVTVVVPGASNVPPARDALEHNYPRLFDAGVEVFEYETVMHAKVVIADDTVVIGTINLDAWALYRNHEIAVLFEDTVVADGARSVLVDDALTRSVPAELEDGIWNRSKDWFWDKLVYFI
ncbi:phospholipase D-like domain-containing protein [soil metagenome]